MLTCYMKSESMGLTHGKVLVIDDNLIIQRTVGLLLRQLGYQALVSGDVTDALAVVRRERPDAILLDINFPDDFSVTGEVRNGFWATEWMSHIEGIKEIPVILMSTANPAEAGPKAEAVGAAAFLPKPLDRGQLTAILQKLIAAKKPDTQLIPILKMTAPVLQ